MRFLKVLFLVVALSVFTIACGSSGGGGDDSDDNNIVDIDLTSPTVPANVLATPASSAEINITWDQSVDPSGVVSGVKGYKVYKAEGSAAADNEYAFLAEVTDPSASDTGLSPYTEYCYKVAAYDTAGNISARSDKACTTIDNNFDTAAPTVPANVIADALSSTKIGLSWNASTDDFMVKGYKVYKDGNHIATVTSGTSFSESGLNTLSKYCYTVSAYDPAGNESAQSSIACATTDANNAPIATIAGPSDGSSYTAGDSISFSGSAFDIEDGTLSGSSFVWISDIYGQIGTGSSFDRSDLCAGPHTITLTATDSEGLPGSDSVNINLDGETWTKRFGGANDDYGYSVQQTSDCGYIIAGYTTDAGTGAKDVYLMKTDSGGNEVWTNTFGGTASERGHSVQQTSDGGYIIAGYTTDAVGDRDVYLLKTDSNGIASWTKTFGGDYEDYGYSVQQTSDGGYIVVGYTMGAGTGTKDVYLIKTDSGGNSEWIKTFGGTASERGRSVQQTSDGGYVITGYTRSEGAGDKDVYLIKTDSGGNEVWTKTFGGANEDYGYSVQQTSDSGYIISGFTLSLGEGAKDVYLIKTDSSGDSEWIKTFGGTASERGHSVQQTSDGGYIIAGYTASEGAGDRDMYLLKTDSGGNKVWTKTFGGAGEDYGYSVQQTTDGGYIIAGFTELATAGLKDVYIKKTDSNGNVN